MIYLAMVYHIHIYIYIYTYICTIYLAEQTATTGRFLPRPYEGFHCSKVGASTGAVCTRIPYMCTHVSTCTCFHVHMFATCACFHVHVFPRVHVSMQMCFHVCTKLVAGKPSRRRQGEVLQSEPANLCLKVRFH